MSSPIAWAEVGENKLIRHEIVQETTDKIVQIKERLKASRDRQKSYDDNRQNPLEFIVGDKVLLRVSPWKGVAQFRRTSLTGFPAQSVGSSNADALESPHLLVLIIGTSQSRRYNKSESDSLIHIESHKSPTAELFDVNSGRISIVTVITKEYHYDVLAIITRIMRRTLDNNL
ncbi:hypothetical protein Tco_0649160 [Tanacetum coccineum]